VSDPTSEQVHDFEPGIAPSGLFWTVRAPDHVIDAQPALGRAEMSVPNMPLRDFHDIINAISPDPVSVPARATFDVTWRPAGPLTRIRDDTFGFSGRYIPTAATVRFAVQDSGSGVVYTSNDAGQVTVSGGVGHERNGVFFDAHEPAAASPARVDPRSRWAAR
jgi:hypothetical protein